MDVTNCSSCGVYTPTSSVAGLSDELCSDCSRGRRKGPRRSLLTLQLEYQEVGEIVLKHYAKHGGNTTINEVLSDWIAEREAGYYVE